MTKKRIRDRSHNYLPDKTSKLIRWPNELLSESEEMAKEMGTNWSDFVRTAVAEKMERLNSQAQQ